MRENNSPRSIENTMLKDVSKMAFSPPLTRARAAQNPSSVAFQSLINIPTKRSTHKKTEGVKKSLAIPQEAPETASVEANVVSEPSEIILPTGVEPEVWSMN